MYTEKQQLMYEKISLDAFFRKLEARRKYSRVKQLDPPVTTRTMTETEYFERFGEHRKFYKEKIARGEILP